MTSRSPLRLRSAQMVCRYLPYRTATVVRPLRELALAVSVATAGFFPLDLGFLVSSGFLGIFVSNLGFFI